MIDVLGLTSFRAEIAKLLRDNLPDDVGVIDYIPDSVAPPVVFFGWASPWITPTTWCDWTAVGEIICVSQRIEPGGHLETLEQLVGTVALLFRANRISIRDVTSPYPLVLGGVDYLATSINIIMEVGE